MFFIDSCKAGFVGNRIPEVVVETIYGEEKIPNLTGFSNENNVGGMARKNPGESTLNNYKNFLSKFRSVKDQISHSTWSY